MSCRHHRYDFHGIDISISGSPAIASALELRLKRFPPGRDTCCELRFEFLVAESPEEHRIRRPVITGMPFYEASTGEATYFPAEDLLYVDYGRRVVVLCDVRQGYCQISCSEPESDSLWLATHALFTIPLLEMLKRRDRLNLHAAGFAKDGHSVLFPGTSGAGKSTLSIALLRGGLDYLGDDLIFLEPGEGVQALAFPEDIDATNDTLTFFEELQTISTQPRRPGWPKYEIRPDQIYGTKVAWRTSPVAIVFPRVAHQTCSVLSPIGPDEAFLELVPSVLLTEPSSTKAHLQALAQLANSAPAYRLSTGTDFAHLPDLVRELLR